MKIAKDVGPPYFLFDTKAFDKCFFGMNQVYIGHNRSKTTGDSTRKCAHPFMFDDVLGAHNGTIDFQNKNRMEKGSDFKTDSEAIFHNIQCHGIGDTIGRIEASEAYALTWYDKRDNTMNVIRNKERPLWYIYTKNRRCMFWASEYEILMAGTGREDYHLDMAEKPYTVTPDTHYKWTIPSSCMTELPEPERNKLENFKKIHYVSSVFRGGYHQGKKDQGTVDKSTDTMFNYGNGYGYEHYGTDAESDLYHDIQSQTHKKLDEEKTILGTITDGIAAIKESLSPGSTRVDETKVMTPEDVMKKMKYEKQKTTEATGVPEEKFPLKYKSSSMMVHLDKGTGNWHTYRWNKSRGEWDRYISANPPGDLPYSILDIEARHQFKHEGKGKHKKVFYKGFRGSLLNQDQFKKFMDLGCLQCDRNPEWGNDVTFLDDNHTFLCEWCSQIPDLVTDLIAKKKAVG